MALIFGATGVLTISSTTPLLAVMLGLAVGIDYALFIVSRHRDQLRTGMAVEESVARAVGTAGSAVVFAGIDRDDRALPVCRSPASPSSARWASRPRSGSPSPSASR